MSQLNSSDGFESLIEFSDGTPPAASSVLSKIKAINWNQINNKATMALNVLNGVAAIIDSIQRMVASGKVVKVNLQNLTSLENKVNATRAALRPIARRRRGAYTLRSSGSLYDEPPFEGLTASLQKSLLEDAGGWEKASIVAAALGAIIALISQLVDLIARYPEYKEKIGGLVSGMKQDAEKLEGSTAGFD